MPLPSEMEHQRALIAHNSATAFDSATAKHSFRIVGGTEDRSYPQRAFLLSGYFVLNFFVPAIAILALRETCGAFVLPQMRSGRTLCSSHIRIHYILSHD